MAVWKPKAVVLRRIGGVAVATALLTAGGCSGDDAPGPEAPVTVSTQPPPGTQAGDLDRNQGQEQGRTRPTTP